MYPRCSKFALTFSLAGLLAAVTTPQETSAQPPVPKQWSAEQVRVIEGLSAPECALPDPASGVVYVSNLEGAPGDSWNNDGKGFISLMTSEGDMKNLRWLDNTPNGPIHGPKGMCFLDGFLYFADNIRLMKHAANAAGPLIEVPLPWTKKLKDVATDGKFIYVSDMELGLVYKVGPQGGQTIIQAPPGVTGITFHNGRMLAVSGDLHEVCELDLSGDNPAKPFGLAANFANLDGIEALDDGTLIVSDAKANKIDTIAPDGKTVRPLADVESPADIGLDRTRGLLYVPQSAKNRTVVFKLTSR